MNFKSFFDKHGKMICFISITLILCILSAAFCELNPDYAFFITFLCAACIVGAIIRMMFVKADKYSAAQILGLIALIICSNHLYSHEKLTTVFPFLKNVNLGIVLVIAMIVSVALAIVIKVYVLAAKDGEGENEDEAPPEEKLSEKSADSKGFLSSLTNKQVQSSLNFIAVSFFMLGIIAVTAFIFNLIYRESIENASMSYSEILMAYIAYGATILGILFVVIVALFVLTSAVRLVVLCIRKIRSKDEKLSDFLPTYTPSVLITLVLFYLAYDRNEFTLDDFTEFAAKGDYLALPLTFLLLIAAFCLFVWIIHNTLMVLRGIKPQEIREKFLDNVGKDVLNIVKNVYRIVIDTLTVALEFVRFIPSYFGALRRFVIDFDDDDSEDITGEVNAQASDDKEAQHENSSKVTSTV